MASRPSRFGNPFKMASESDRARCVADFKAWFVHGTDDAAVRMRYHASLLPDDAVLLCWCAPKLCHAQVIADYENNRRASVIDVTGGGLP